MNPLRKLAKGYGLLVGGPGEGSSPWGIWKYAEAPASCFGEAEEPLRNGDRVVATGGERPGEHGVVEDSCDGDGHSILWVEYDNEKGRGTLRKNLRHEREDERPAEKKPDPEGWKREFYPTDASECPKENAVAHSLQKWRGYRKTELNRYGLDAPPIPASHKHCALCTHHWITANRCERCPLPSIMGSPCGRAATYDVWDDLRDPEPMIAALEKCLEQEQAKHEPKPEPLLRRFMPGQWVQLRDMRGTISFYDPHLRAYSVRVRQGPGSGEDWWWHAESCIPCVPVITNEMKLLCWPGTRVSGVEHPADETGKPYPADGRSHDSCAAGRTGVVLNTGNEAAPAVEVRLDGVWHSVHPWNLEPSGS